jgi:AGCS family alanine or glycine:cation symporter
MFLGAGVYYAFSQGMRRAIFSNEAGQGTAPMVHAAAKTDHPAREGIVGGIGPFIDTIIICTLTALVILLSGAWNSPGPGEVEVPLAVEQVETGSNDMPAWQVVDSTTGRAAVPIEALPERERSWADGDAFFFKGDTDGELRPHDGGHSRIRINGTIQTNPNNPQELIAAFNTWRPDKSQWTRLPTEVELDSPSIFIPYEGTELTAFAFDKNIPGVGRWLVTLAAWLFSISTMISYAFYGEQGVGYFSRSKASIRNFRVLFILVAAGAPFLAADIDTLVNIIDVGSGLMIWANIPILLITGWIGIRALNQYFDEGGHHDR